jgi:hypothetical protein
MRTIENSNGTFSVIDDRDEPAERDFAAERKADRIDHKSVLALLGGWTDEDLARARALFNFPAPLGFRYRGWLAPKRTATYSRQQITQWSDELRLLAAKLRR